MVPIFTYHDAFGMQRKRGGGAVGVYAGLPTLPGFPVPVFAVLPEGMLSVLTVCLRL